MKRQAKSSRPATGFHSNQLRKLQRAIDQRHVHVREVEGRQLSYIEGWYAISQANEIFGYAGWDRETVFFERTLECIKADMATCGYAARVRLRVRAGSTEICREGTGWGYASARTPAAAHERALKSAETDATKRALSTFGAQFGLSLYDKEASSAGRLYKCVLFAPEGHPFADNLSPEAFATGLRQLIEKCESASQISALIFWNHGSLSGLRSKAPDLRNRQGMHFTDLLLRLAERAIRKFEASTSMHQSSHKDNDRGTRLLPASHSDREETAPVGNGFIKPISEINGNAGPASASLAVGFLAPTQALKGEDEFQGSKSDATVILLPPPAREAASRIGNGQRIDKSALLLGFERRVRSKLHLKRVAELPCLICNRQPSHAHHIKYAQRRGLSQKVSDEFVVPLCALHHGDLHRASSERQWWEKQGQEPLAIAASLWERFGKDIN